MVTIFRQKTLETLNTRKVSCLILPGFYEHQKSDHTEVVKLFHAVRH